MPLKPINRPIFFPFFRFLRSFILSFYFFYFRCCFPIFFLSSLSSLCYLFFFISPYTPFFHSISSFFICYSFVNLSFNRPSLIINYLKKNEKTPFEINKRVNSLIHASKLILYNYLTDIWFIFHNAYFCFYTFYFAIRVEWSSETYRNISIPACLTRLMIGKSDNTTAEISANLDPIIGYWNQDR